MPPDSHQIMLPPPRPQTVLLSVQVLPPQQPDFTLNGAKRDVTNNIGGRGSVASKSKAKRKARATAAMASDDNDDDLEPFEQHAHTHNESFSSLARIDKFLLPVKADDSLGDVWRQVERQYERMYPHKARNFRIKKLQNGTGYDLHLDFRVRDMFPESLAEKVLKVHQVYNIREMSILPESSLRPQHTPFRSDITRKRGRKSPPESTSKRRRLAHQPELQDMEEEDRDDEAREDNVDVPRPTLEAKPEDEVAEGVFAAGGNVDIDNNLENKSPSRRRSSPSVIVHSDERSSSFRSRTSSGPRTQPKAGKDNIASVRGKSRRTLSSLANGAQVSGAQGFHVKNVLNDDSNDASNDAIDGHVSEEDTFGQFSRQRTSTSQPSDRVHIKHVFDAPESPGEDSGRTQSRSMKRSIGKLSKTPARVVDLSRMRSLMERSQPQSRPSSSAAPTTVRENSSPATLRRTSQSTGLLSNQLTSMGIEVPASPQSSDPDQAQGKEERKKIQNKNASRRQRYIRELQTLIDTSKGRTDSHGAIKKTTPSLKSTSRPYGRKGAIAKSNAAAVSRPEAPDSHDIINEAVFSSKSRKTTKTTTKPTRIRSKPTVAKGSEVCHEESKPQNRKQSSSHNEDDLRAQKTTISAQDRAASAQSWMTTDALDDLGAFVAKRKSSAQKPRQYEEDHTEMLVDEASTVDLDETMESPSLEKSLRQAKAKPLSNGRSSNRETPTDNDDSTSRLGEAAAQQLLMEEQASLERQDHTSSNSALGPDETNDHDSESTSDESDANDKDAAALVTDRDEEEEDEGGQKASERDEAKQTTEANNLEVDIDAKSEEENADHKASPVRPRSMSPDLGDPILKMSSASLKGKNASHGQDNNSQSGTSGAEEQSNNDSEDDSEDEADEEVLEAPDPKASDPKAQVESNDADARIDSATGQVATENDQHPLSVDSTKSVTDANSAAVEQVHSDLQQDAGGDYEMNTQEASIIIPESPMATSTRARNATTMSTTLQSSHPVVEDSQPQVNIEYAVAQTSSVKLDEKAAAPSHSSDSGSDSGSDSESESNSAAGSESGFRANSESPSNSDSDSYDEIAPRQITGPVDISASTARPESTESPSSDSDESIDEIRPRRIPRPVGHGVIISVSQPAMMHSYNTPMAPPSPSLSRRPKSQPLLSEPSAMSDGPRTLQELAAGQRSPSPLPKATVTTKTIALDSSDDDEESEDEESDDSRSDSDDPKEKTADKPKTKLDQKTEESESEYEESSSSSDDEIAAEFASQKLKKSMLATARPNVEKRAAPDEQRHSGDDLDDSEQAKVSVRKAYVKPNERAVKSGLADNKTPAKTTYERSTSSASQRSLKRNSVTSTPILPSPRASGPTPSFQHTPAKNFRASQPTPGRKVQKIPPPLANRLSATQPVSRKKQRGTPAPKTQAQTSKSSTGRGSSTGASLSLKKTYSTTPVSPPGVSRR